MLIFKKIWTRMKKRSLTISIALAVCSLSYSLYLHHRIGSGSLDERMIELVNVEALHRNFYIGYQRILNKVAMYQKMNIPNGDINLEVMEYYEMAINLAKQNDNRYKVMEIMGDRIVENYLRGVKDGRKAFLWGI